MYKIHLYSLLILILSSQQYSKTFYTNGKLKSEGWLEEGNKIRYWFYYHPNGKIKSKGHYKDDRKEDYWYYYDKSGMTLKEGSYDKGLKKGWWKQYKKDTIIEIEYKNSKKEGLSIYKVNGRPVKAEYYKNDVKTNEWHTLREFKREYPKVND
jgi:antitoxin component YwqK of YwqJK toxin-antitoxin module